MKNIVVFDPDARSAEQLEQILTRSGYRVETTHDGPTALAAVRCTAPDLFVVAVDDVHRAGLGLLRTARVRAPLVPVIAIGHVDWGAEDVLHAALRLGASDTVLKPLSSERLLRRVTLLAPATTPRAGITAPASSTVDFSADIFGEGREQDF